MVFGGNVSGGETESQCRCHVYNLQPHCIPSRCNLLEILLLHVCSASHYFILTLTRTAGLSRDVLLLDRITRTWTDIGAGLAVGGEVPEKLINFGFVAARGSLYVFGGCLPSGT